MEYREHGRNEKQGRHGRKAQAANHGTTKGRILLPTLTQSDCHRDHEDGHAFLHELPHPHVAAWLARAVADGFGDGPQTISEEAYRVGSLERILNDAAASDSPRRVLGAFVESLRVWENVTVHVYAAAARPGFMMMFVNRVIW